MLKLSVTLILEAHCPSCGRGDLPLGENARFGVVAVCPGCGWEHQVRFLQEGAAIDTGEVLTEIQERLQEALARMDLPQDVHLTPARERRESRADTAPSPESGGDSNPPPPPPSGFFEDEPPGDST
jgi:hypothetical protein